MMNRSRGGVVQQRLAAQRRYAPSETGADDSVASEVGSAAPVNELFQAIKLGQSLQVAVDNWIATYKEDANEALCELLNLLMIVSGCRGQISGEHLAVESTVVIQQLTEQFDEDSGEYPFMSNGQHARRLRANFADFLLIFMRQIQHSIVFDEFLVENFLNFVIALTDSQVRAFRHTATFAAMKILTGLVESSLQLRTNLEHAKKQYDAERARVEASRRGGAAANERVANLREKCDELEKQNKVLGDFQATLFKGVFVHRYRDTLTDIRVLCMHEIGTWIRRAPFTYLDDSYLKYVGWTLYDKVAEVRLECLRTLIALYENAAFVTRLELFTNRFRERLVEMTSDREPEVALNAVKLLRLIHQRTPDLLPDKDCEAVFELIFSANRALAQAAGEFLNQKLFSRVRPAATEEESAALASNYSERHYSADDYRRVLRQTVAFFNEAEMHEHAAYLVDALLERNPALKQWRIVTGMLLSDADADQTDADLGIDGGLSSKEEAVLIDMLVCTVRQACTGEAPVGRGAQSASTAVQKRAQKEQKALHEERRRMTEHFIIALPNLLARFLTDSEKLANLLQIPAFMQLDLYVTNRQERYLDQLLKLLCEIVEKHQDDDVLIRTARIFELLTNRYRANSADADADDADGGVPFVSESHAHKVNVVLGNLLDKLTQRYATASQTYAAAIEDADEHDETNESALNDSIADEQIGSSVAYQTLSALRKLVAFYQLHDLSGRALFDGFAMLVERNLQKPSLGNTSFEIVKRALSGMAFALQWGALYFETLATRAGGEQLLHDPGALDAQSRRAPVKFAANEQMELRRLGERIRIYFTFVHSLLERHGSGAGRIEQLEETLALTSDLLVLFSRNLLDLNAPDLAVHLVFTPAEDFLSTFVRRVEQYVFVPRDSASGKRAAGNQPGAGGDEEIDAAKLDALHKRRNVLAALCKLVIFNLVPQRAAVGMFARYAAYYNDYGDLIRNTLVKSRELSRDLHAEAIAEALQLAFRRPQAAQTGNAPLFIERASTQFAALKELAKKLALSFGADLHRNKETVRRIHEYSIRFMFDTYRVEKVAFDAHVQAQAQADAGQLAPRVRAHPHHVFLLAEPLLEFAGRLVGPDKKYVFQMLEQQLVANGIDLRNRPDAFWQALNSYRSSLAVDGSLLQQATVQPAAPAARANVQLAMSTADSSLVSGQFKVPGATAMQTQAMAAAKRRLDAEGSGAAPLPSVATAQNVVVTVKRPRHEAEGGPVATSQIIIANQSAAATTPTMMSTRAGQFARQ